MLRQNGDEGGPAMNPARSVLLPLIVFAGAGVASATEVAVCTDRGRAVFELADAQSPQQVANFLRYVDMGYYAGTVFHRVKPGFVVQGGGVDRQLHGRSTLPPVANESSNGLSNLRGTVAAARTEDPDSATAQFFVNLEDNPALDASGSKPGYTVFARVKEGIKVFDDISRLPTRAAGQFRGEVPNPLVAIRSMARVDEAALGELPEAGREAQLKQRILEAAAAANYSEVRRLVDAYHSICGTDDPGIELKDAEAALETNQQRRAVFVLENYFATAEPNAPTYETATALYRRAVPENQQSATALIDECPPPGVPAVPDGGAAALDEMMAGQKKVKEFVAAGTTYLGCLTKIIDNVERPIEQRNAAIAEHNRMVDAMQQTAAGFNEQIHKFKARGN
jgi:peptidyl-prolyl cis-trans isomerase A (cyclophilin A)